jgi:ATP-dependent helicase HrpA
VAEAILPPLPHRTGAGRGEGSVEASGDGLPRTRAQFETAVEHGRAAVVERGEEVARVVRGVLVSLKEVRALLGSMTGAVFGPTRESVLSQLGSLLAPGWIRATPAGWWHQLPKYVRAVARRLERARGDVERDRKLQAQVERYEAELRRFAAGADPDMPAFERERLRWMLEEFRLSLFAQDLKTLLPVSAKRLDEQLQLAQREARGLPAARSTSGTA